MAEKLNIKEWAADDRPREKMMAKGAGELTDPELLAILIGSGNANENAVMLMQRILSTCDHSLTRLGRMSCEELCQFPGIGPAKAITILAACELGNRRAVQRETRTIIRSASQVYEYYYPIICDLPTEHSYALMLGASSRIIKSVPVSAGGMTETLVDARVVMREALLCRATHFVFVHNHPSGNVTPSRQDDQLTSHLAEAGKLMNVRLIDHVIVTDGAFFSYADEGKL